MMVVYCKHDIKSIGRNMSPWGGVFLQPGASITLTLHSRGLFGCSEPWCPCKDSQKGASVALIRFNVLPSADTVEFVSLHSGLLWSRTDMRTLQASFSMQKIDLQKPEFGHAWNWFSICCFPKGSAIEAQASQTRSHSQAAESGELMRIRLN